MFLMQKASGKKTAVDKKKKQTNSTKAVNYHEEKVKEAWRKGSRPHLMRNGKSVTAG